MRGDLPVDYDLKEGVAVETNAMKHQISHCNLSSAGRIELLYYFYNVAS